MGTSKGIILMFDYNQNLKLIIGPGTKGMKALWTLERSDITEPAADLYAAVEAGAITSVAVSADHTTVAGGHADGSIFTWDTTRAARPFLHIPPPDPPAHPQQPRTADGHVPGVAVTHLGFLGTRHTALVSADDRGMAFSHLATRGTGSLGRTVKTTRILGRYPNAPAPAPADGSSSSKRTPKPSTVLAFAPLPLGNAERATDTMGLTAMLTPYLLVVVSTTPVAQTQHKAARPRESATPHGALSGCLAWFPAVRLKVPDAVTGSTVSKVKLVYCWSHVLTVLDVDEIPSEDRDKPPSLRFRARSRWRCDEPIVAVQWLSRSVLTLLTITQRLVVLEDRSMRVTEAFDLIHKHIYHVDLFSKQLYGLVEQLDEDEEREGASMHGVVADAFYMSFKTYKGRIFLLGFSDVSVGALSNWADRLIALMEHGDYVGAIRLATSYYTGDADKLTVGLPEDVSLRHSMVRDKLMEIMSASLRYAFGQRRKNKAAADDAHLRELAETCFIACRSVDEGEKGSSSGSEFLFDEMYEWYEDAGLEGIFLETLEPYVLERAITMVPPAAVKAMVGHYVAAGWESRLEEMICHMDTATLDLDQVTALCKRHGLYDALIYVWNQALRDYITPMMDLLALLVPLVQNGDTALSPPRNPMEDENYGVNALKMFPYLSYTLTGRVYPTGDRMDDDVAFVAKSELYWFLFSGKSITWPRGSNRRLLTRPGQHDEPSFPYLRMILRFDAPSFLSALNEAFEDPFLNDDSPDKLQLVNGSTTSADLPEELVFGSTVNRQVVVTILSEIMNPADFAREDTIYLDMFIARNLPKFPQYLLFPDSILVKVLTGLCHYPGEDLAEDAQLSAEYLLSVYHPPDMSALMPLLKKAGFYRILKRTYKVEKQYGKLVQAYFDDPNDRESIFETVNDCLRPQAGLTKRQVQDVHDVLRHHARDFVELDPVQAAFTIDSYAPELHESILEALDREPRLQYEYLRAVMEPGETPSSTASEPARRQEQQTHDRALVEQYVRLMCRFNPSHVSDYVGLVQLQSTNLRLEELLPTMEETGVVDAAVVLLAREGLVQRAMERLVRHLDTLESALHGLLTGVGATATADGDDKGKEAAATSVPDAQAAAEDILRSMQRFAHVGIWLCQGQTKMAAGAATVGNVARRGKRGATSESSLTPEELLWLNLIDANVQITRRVSATLDALKEEQKQQERASEDEKTVGEHAGDGEQAIAEVSETTKRPPPSPSSFDAEKLLSLLRSLVQHTFTALLTSTSTAPALGPPANASVTSSTIATTTAVASMHLSFLRVLRAFLTRAATRSPTLADLRAVLASVFAAYAYEESILRLASRLLDRSLFGSVEEVVALRRRGWRPRGSTCEACGRRVWGPGVTAGAGGTGREILEKWEERERAEERRRRVRLGLDRKGIGGSAAVEGVEEQRSGKGKAAAAPLSDGESTAGSGAASAKGKGKGKDTAITVTGKGKSREPVTDDRPAADGRGGAPDEDEAANDAERRNGEMTPTEVLIAAGVLPHLGTPATRPLQKPLGPLVVFACRHIYHRDCLDEILAQEEASGLVAASDRRRRTGMEREYRCPIDS